MAMPVHVQVTLDELRGLRDRIDTAIVTLETVYDASTVVRETKSPEAPRAPKPKPAADAATEPAVIVAIPQTPPVVPTPVSSRPANRDEDILFVLRHKAPPVGLPAADIVRRVFPDAPSAEMKALTGRFWGTLQRLVRDGRVVEDSRLYALSTAERLKESA